MEIFWRRQFCGDMVEGDRFRKLILMGDAKMVDETLGLWEFESLRAWSFESLRNLRSMRVWGLENLEL